MMRSLVTPPPSPPPLSLSLSLSLSLRRIHLFFKPTSLTVEIMSCVPLSSVLYFVIKFIPHPFFSPISLFSSRSPFKDGGLLSACSPDRRMSESKSTIQKLFTTNAFTIFLIFKIILH